MPLSAGTRLGPYEIQSPLGAGGMGEVYRARDTRLDRTVAIKILPHADPELKARFEREAKSIAALQHPHICALFDVGEAPNPEFRTQNAERGTASPELIQFLVMEYLEGETLSARLQRGALTIDHALRTAIEIASALDAAHRAGIVHRDLKPGNVMLTKAGTKLLDFGLARTGSPVSAGAGLQTSPNVTAPPTMSAPMTIRGTILGTLQYMAPEQLEGKDADYRADIWAFGCIVHEMLTGAKTFDGASPASVIGAILKDAAVPISKLQALSPPLLDSIVGKCLAKDPGERWQSAKDLGDALRWSRATDTGAAVEAPHASRRTAFGRAAAAVLLVALAGTFVWTRRDGTSTDNAPARLVVLPPDGAAWPSGPGAPHFIVSPDGRSLALTAVDLSGIPHLWIRRLDTLTAQPLRSTEGASFPFWAPDSRHIGFFADGKLKKIDLIGGPPVVVCDTPRGEGGTWNRNGDIVFGQRDGGLSRVSSEGGAVETLTLLDQAGGEREHLWPQFLPDGSHFIYLVRTGDAQRSGIYVSSLESRDRRRILETQHRAVFAQPGYFLFMRDRVLLAQPSGADGLHLTGTPVPLADQMSFNPNGRTTVSTSDNGVLMYRATNADLGRELIWYDRQGREGAKVGEVAVYQYPALSPEGTRVAVWILDKAQRDIWILDVARGSKSRFTIAANLNADSVPLWSPDGAHMVYRSDVTLPPSLYLKAVSSGSEEMLGNTGFTATPTSWSPDGRSVLYQDASPETRADIWLLTLSGDRTPTALLKTPASERGARFSPDGRWIAYISDESGTEEVFVRQFPVTAAKWQVSVRGALAVTWRADGKELFFLSLDNTLMAVDVRSTSAAFEVGAPHPLFRLPDQGGGNARSLVVTGDGQKMLVLKPQALEPPPLTVILNWPALAKK